MKKSKSDTTLNRGYAALQDQLGYYGELTDLKDIVAQGAEIILKKNNHIAILEDYFIGAIDGAIQLHNQKVDLASKLEEAQKENVKIVEEKADLVNENADLALKLESARQKIVQIVNVKSKDQLSSAKKNIIAAVAGTVGAVVSAFMVFPPEHEDVGRTIGSCIIGILTAAGVLIYVSIEEHHNISASNLVVKVQQYANLPQKYKSYADGGVALLRSKGVLRTIKDAICGIF